MTDAEAAGVLSASLEELLQQTKFLTNPVDRAGLAYIERAYKRAIAKLLEAPCPIPDTAS